jgi:putative redox protein
MKYKMEKPVHGTIGAVKYSTSIEWRNGVITADEPVNSGGLDTGPDPYTLLLASLASCTLITLRMYIDRKEWDIPSITVDVNMFQYPKDGNKVTVFDRDIKFGITVSKEQRERLTEIARACPISKIVIGEVDVRTYVYNEDETEKQIKYSNEDITVIWKPQVCQHSGRCVTQLSSVFNKDTHPWINMTGGATAEIIQQVNKCPTGALTYIDKRTTQL